MRYCKNCIMPDTRPQLTIDRDGYCSACRAHYEKKKKINWEQRFEELREITNKYRNKDGKNYDCVIPVSGGKDSTFQTHVIKRILGLNPLCVTFAACQSTEIGKKNLQNLREMGVDHILFTPNPISYRRLARLGFEKVGDNCLPCHAGIFTYPVKIATMYKIPLLIWGENSQLEYGGPATAQDNNTLDRRWLDTFGGMLGENVDTWLKAGFSMEELLPYDYPSDDEINSVGVTGIFLGYYINWNARLQLETVTKDCGFSVRKEPVTGAYLNYENLDCGFVSIHDYLMYLKFGFGRATTQLCIDIRNGKITREEALEFVKKYDGRVDNISQFCEFIGISEREFWKTCESFRDSKAWAKSEKGGWVKNVEE